MLNSSTKFSISNLGNSDKFAAGLDFNRNLESNPAAIIFQEMVASKLGNGMLASALNGVKSSKPVASQFNEKESIINGFSKSLVPLKPSFPNIALPDRKIESGIKKTITNLLPDNQFVLDHKGTFKTNSHILGSKFISSQAFETLQKIIDVFVESANNFKPAQPRKKLKGKSTSLLPAANVNFPKKNIIASNYKITDRPGVLKTIQNIVATLTDASFKGLDGKIQVGMKVKSLGGVFLQAEHTAGKVNLEISVDSQFAKNWLQTRLASLGHKVQQIDIQVKDLSANPKLQSQEGMFQLKTKIPASQTLDTIQRIVEAVTHSPLNSEPIRIQVGMEVEAIGQLLVLVKRSQGQVRVELSTESLAAKDWLMQQLSESEIKVDDIKVLKEKPELKEGHGKQQRQILTPNKQNSKPRFNTVQNKMTKHRKQTKPIHNSHVDRRVPVASKDTPPLTEYVGTSQKVIREEILAGTNGKGFSKKISNRYLALKKNMEQNLNYLNLAKIPNANFTFLGNKLINFGRLERSTFPDMMQKIIEMTKAQSHSAGQKLAIQMDVESLGSLLVDAFKQKDKIHIQINVENSEVRRLLENQLKPLLNQFMKDGIEIGKLEVSVRDQNSENQSGGKAGQNELNSFETSNKLSSQTRTEFIEDAITAQPWQRDFGYNSIEIWA